MRQIDSTKSTFQISLVLTSNFFNLLDQVLTAAVRQHSNSIFVAFSVANNNVPLIKADVFDSQSTMYSLASFRGERAGVRGDVAGQHRTSPET